MGINKKINEIAEKLYDGNNSKMAIATGTSEANIRNYRNNVTPKLDFIVKLQKLIEVSFDELLLDEKPVKYERELDQTNLIAEPENKYLLKSDVKKDLQAVPLYDVAAAAGLTKVFQKKNTILDYITVPDLPKCDGAIRITGDSMYPLLKSGDIVMYKIVKNIDEGIFWGEMYLLSVKIDGEYMTLVKYIQKSKKGDDYISLVSQNSHHEPKDVAIKGVKSLALIKASIRINSMN